MYLLSWFDNRTLIACHLMLATLFAAAFFSTRRVYPHLRGIASMAVAFLLAVPGSLLLVAPGPIPYLAAVMLANALVLGSLLFLNHGILRFLGSRRSPVIPYAGSALALALIYCFTQLQDNAVARIVVLSLAVGLVRGIIADELFRRFGDSPNPKVVRTLAVSTAFFAAANVICGLVTLLCGSPSTSLWSSAAASISLMLGVVSVSTTGLLLLFLCHNELIAHSKDESQKDALSGVFNRRGIEAQLAAELKNIHRGNQKLSIALFDVDHFKSINDIQGHAAGDAALCGIASAVSSRLRGRDSLGRYGGDEFLLILPQTAATMATLVVERIQESVDELSVTGRRQRITLSIGLTEAVPDDDALTLIDRADKALYKAKRDGRNCMRLIRAGDYVPAPPKSKAASRGDLRMPALPTTLAQP